jgi:hypothetical protein
MWKITIVRCTIGKCEWAAGENSMKEDKEKIGKE